MPGCLVISIDVGRKNTAICGYECLRRQIVFWRVYDLQLKEYNAPVYRKRVEQIFRELPVGDVYLIEKQVAMAPKNCLIEAFMHGLVAWRHKKSPQSVNPADVRRFFSLRHDSKYFKKQDAVHITDQVVRDTRRAAITFQDPGVLEAYLTARGLKRDDLADCFLQAVYWAEKNISRREQFVPGAYQHYSGTKAAAAARKRERTEEAAAKKLEKAAAKKENLATADAVKKDRLATAAVAKKEGLAMAAATKQKKLATVNSTIPDKGNTETLRKRKLTNSKNGDDGDSDSRENETGDEESSSISDSFLFTSPLKIVKVSEI